MVPNNNALRFKVVSVFYWSPDITGRGMLPIPRVRLGATYLLDRWDP